MQKFSKNTKMSPLLALFFGILVVSTASVLIRGAQKEASSLVIAAYRLLIASLILLPVVLAGHTDELRRLSKKQVLLAMVSGTFLAFHFATWISSLEYTTVASSVVLVSTTPLWVALLSPWVLHERSSRLVVVGMAIALIGGTVVGLSDTCHLSAGGLACSPITAFVQGKAFLGDLLALAGALSASVYLLVGRGLRPKISLVVYIFSVYSIAAIVLVMMALISGQPVIGFPPITYLFLVLLAVGPQLMGHTAYNYGLGYLPAALVAVAMLGEPVGSTILALILLKEIPNLLEIAGGVLILVGIYLASRGQSTPVDLKKEEVIDEPL
jgi:drug/metabolite transporter (DMT)-like permease